MARPRARFGRWIFRQIVRLILACLILIGFLFGGCYVYFVHLHPLRPILDAAIQQRVETFRIRPLTYEEIPVFYREAVISTEDRRFESDPGIDPVGIARSVFVDIGQDGYVEGGSTITQQLADNTILNQDKTIRRKILQAVYAIGIYDTMSKKQTFANYANVIYFGHQAYGLANAAETYFGMPVNQLNSGELAMLAGLPNAPSVYDPFRNINLAREREQKVLKNMVDAGHISSGDAKKIFQESIRLK